MARQLRIDVTMRNVLNRGVFRDVFRDGTGTSMSSLFRFGNLAVKCSKGTGGTGFESSVDPLRAHTQLCRPQTRHCRPFRLFLEQIRTPNQGRVGRFRSSLILFPASLRRSR